LIVRKWEINVPVNPSEFELEFAPGTIVNNHRAESRYRYVVTQGGGERIITGAEFQRGAPYDELLRTESGQAGLPSPRTAWTTYASVGALSISVVALGIYFFLKWRRARS
jgi:hypothetical protein